jgi:pyruvate/2-oxoglutarate dehydrogenase complex dihydrolipoamide dehydrogenase (E3) component
MAQPEHFSILVLGSGAGGKLIAWHMASAGRRTAVVERKWIGGACPNIACMPSKNEISSARVAHLVRNAGEFGWTLNPGAIDMAVVRRRKRGDCMMDDVCHWKQLERKVAAVVRQFEFLDLRSYWKC